MANLNLIKKVINAPGISGRENKIREIIQKIAAPYAESLTTDNLGNLIAFKKGTSPAPKKLMFAAHMDEIGFLITFIDDKGFIRVSPIGGIHWDAAAFTGVVFENGVKGVIVPEAQISPSEYNAAKFYIDIGASNKKEAEKRVKIGDFAVMEPGLRRLSGRRYAGRPLDDRIGCAVMLEACIKSSVCANDTYFVFTTQEEVGCRGVKSAAFSIAPDYAAVFDVTKTGDTINSLPMAVKLGGGAAIKIKDSSVLCDIDFVNIMRNLAEKNKIKYQLEILEAGGTDTSAIQATGAGVVAGAISIPTRYIHSGSEMIDTGDYDACVELALKLLETPL